MFRALMVGLVAIIGFAVAACSSGGDTNTAGTGDSPKGEDSTRTASADGIDVQATWRTQEAASQDFDLADYQGDRFLFLEVKLDTHSGDLMSIELPTSAELRQGDRQFEPEAWVAGNDDAHHREGLLVVAREFEEGPIELRLQLGDDILSLRWDTVPRA